MNRRALFLGYVVYAVVYCAISFGIWYVILTAPNQDSARVAFMGLVLSLVIIFVVMYIPARRKRLADEAELQDLYRKYPRSVINLLSVRERK